MQSYQLINNVFIDTIIPMLHHLDSGPPYEIGMETSMNSISFYVILLNKAWLQLWPHRLAL